MATTKKSSSADYPGSSDKLQAIFEQTSLIQEELAKLTKKVNHYLFMARLSAIVWLILILGPIIAGIIFLPPLVKNLTDSYQGLLPFDAKTLNSLRFPGANQ